MNGRNVPKKKRKAAAQIIAKAGSFKGRKNSRISSFLRRGVSLDFTVTLAMASIPKIMNAVVLIVQA